MSTTSKSSDDTLRKAEATMLAVHFHEFLRYRLRHKEGTMPFDPKHTYGKLDISTEWSRMSEDDKAWWIDAAAEWFKKQREGRL
jgi:hypothetical protein